MKSKDTTQNMPATPAPINAEYYSDGNLLGKITNTGGIQKQEIFMSPFEKTLQGISQQYLPSTITSLFETPQGEKDSWRTMADATKANQMSMFREDSSKNRDSLVQNLSGRGAFGGRRAGSSQVNYFGNELAKNENDKLAQIANNYTSNMQNYEANYNNKLANLINILTGQQAQQQAVNQATAGNTIAGYNAGNAFNLNNYQNQMNNWALQQALAGKKSGGLGGALTGAVSGAGLGSTFGPWGTLGGAIIGGVGGAL